MSRLNTYLFDNMSRLGNDTASSSESNLQNTSFGSYTVMNYFTGNCGNINKQMEFATSQPNVFVTGGKNTVGVNGCLVEQNTSLRSVQTNAGGAINLFTRPFATIPYLGRGPYNIEQEVALQQGDSNSNRRSVNGLSELPYTDNHHYPLIDSIKRKISNPDNLVEKGPRGGSASRLKEIKLNKR
jgi:hypothetical protein